MEGELLYLNVLMEADMYASRPQSQSSRMFMLSTASRWSKQSPRSKADMQG